MRKAYQILSNKKQDAANKIVHGLLKHEHVYMQDENLSGWHKGLFGRTVQHSVLGLIKAKLIRKPPLPQGEVVHQTELKLPIYY